MPSSCQCCYRAVFLILQVQWIFGYFMGSQGGDDISCPLQKLGLAKDFLPSCNLSWMTAGLWSFGEKGRLAMSAHQQLFTYKLSRCLFYKTVHILLLLYVYIIHYIYFVLFRWTQDKRRHETANHKRKVLLKQLLWHVDARLNPEKIKVPNLIQLTSNYAFSSARKELFRTLRLWHPLALKYPSILKRLAVVTLVIYLTLTCSLPGKMLQHFQHCLHCVQRQMKSWAALLSCRFDSAQPSTRENRDLRIDVECRPQR